MNEFRSTAALRLTQALALFSWAVLPQASNAADAAITAWNATQCAGCHSSPIDSNSASTYSYIQLKNANSYDIAKTRSVSWITNFCSTAQSIGGGSGTTMCSSYGTTYMVPFINSTTNPSGFTNADAVAIVDYIRLVRTIPVSPASGSTLTFSSVRLDAASSTSTQAIVLKNYRGQPASISTSSSSSDFTSTSDCPSNEVPASDGIDPGTCTVTVRFRPLSSSAQGTAASRSATFTVNFTPGVPVAASSAVAFETSSASYTLSGEALKPTITIGGWSGAFNANVGSSITRTATVTKGGSSASSATPLNFSALTLSSNLSGDFALRTPASVGDCTASTVLTNNGDTCNLALTFAPVSLAGTHSVTVNITHNAPIAGSTSTANASGTPLQGTFGPITGGSGNFGTVLQGSSSATQSFTISNTGSATLSTLAFNLSGTNPADFTRTGGTCTTSLANGATCTVIYRFTPATSPVLAPAGTSGRSATLTASSSNASNANPTAGFSGTSQGLASPTASAPAAFPSTQVGTASASTRTITITNPRANAVTYSANTSGPNASDFTVSAESCAPGRSVPGGNGTCTVTYSFTPSLALANNTRSASADITLAGTGTDPTPTNSPIAVALSGPATTAPAFAISSSSLTLSSVVNIAASPVTLTVTNSGTAALVLSSLTVGGSNPADYTLGGTCANGSSLAGTLAAPRSTCTISVTFTPGAVGTRNATLTIAHNDGTVNSGSTVVSLNGTGNPSLTPVLDIGGTSQLAFGNVLQGGNSQLGFTIRNGNTNGGASALQMNSLGISGAASSDYTLGGTCTATTTLASNTSCTVTVTFAPGAAGARTASLAIGTTNAGNATVTLSGTGVALADATMTGVPLAAFPSTLVTTTSATTGTVTINNPRANSLTYGTAFGGANASDFQLGSESCATRVIPGGGSCTVAIRFTPANGAAGTRSASLFVSFIGFGTDPNPVTLSTAVSGTAELPAPAFSSSSNSLSFTAVVLTPTTRSAVITNTGTASLSLSGLVLSGTQASDFLLDGTNTCTGSTTLAPSSSCTLVLRYDPAAAGTSNATLSITSNAAGSPHSLTLTGTATPTPRPRISLSSLALSFGSLQVGTPGSQTIQVQNAGDATLTFSGFTISGAASSDFSRSGTCATGSPLAPSAQCDLTLTFNPTAAGSRNASLAVNSDASNGNAAVSLSGTGVPVPAPVVALSVLPGQALNFGSQTVGGLYPSRRVTLTNSGNAALAISSVAVEGAAFSNASASACPTTLAAGTSCDIDVAFTPTAAATGYNGKVRVISNAASSPDTADLFGSGVATAVPSVVWDPLVSRMDFGQVNAGAVSVVQSATLKNNGPGGVRLTLLNAVGPDASAFSVTAGSCQVGETLFEGQTCRIDIRFAPANAGTKTANVQVASSGSFPTDLQLNGIGMGGPNPGLGLSVRTLPFGNVRVGNQSQPAEITLSANGSGVVRVTGLLASDGWTVQPKSCPALPFNLQAGSECTLTLVFTPRAVGSATGQLTVTSDATNGTNQQVALSGSGEAAPELSSGGCSISQGDAAADADPTLALLVLLALAGLAHRRHLRRQVGRRVP